MFSRHLKLEITWVHDVKVKGQAYCLISSLKTYQPTLQITPPPPRH